MGFDFSALDAELAALGTEPAGVLQLAANFAGSLSSLADADRLLSELESGVAVVRPPPRLELTRLPEPEAEDVPLELADEDLTTDEMDVAPTPPHDNRGVPGPFGSTPLPPNEPRLIEVSGHRPESGEMALPEPVKRPQEDPISGELALVDSDPPTSGSFALPANDAEEDLSPVFTSDLPSSPMQPRSERPLPNVRTYSEGPELHVGELSDEDEDPDTQAVFAAFDDAPSAAPSGETRLKGLSDLPAALGQSRDPDAEFDAIFSDATSPSGLPTKGFSLGDEDAPSAEELLTGLETPASEEEPEPEDQTEVMTLGTIGAIIPVVKDDNPFRDEQEIGSSEFEIVLDEGTPEAAAPPPPSKPPRRSPPPPLPPSGSTSLDKRPSFLGRLFGRKDGPPAGEQ